MTFECHSELRGKLFPIIIFLTTQNMSSTASENVQSDNPSSNAINELIDFLVSELKVNNDKASALRSRVGEFFKTSSPVKTEKKTSTRKSKKDDADAKHCQYELGKRSKTPGQKCGGKVCEESTSGLYCKKHVKQEQEKPVKEKKASKAEKKEKDGDEKETKKPTKPKGKSKNAEASSVQTLKDSAPVCTVKKNKFNNYEHEGTGFLFNRETQKVYGKQKNDGTVAPLTAEDVEACRSMGFEFDLPPNLTSKDDKQAENDDEELEESEGEGEEAEEEDDEADE